MRFVTIRRNGSDEPGLLVDNRVIALRDAGFESVVSIIQGGAVALATVRRWAEKPPGNCVLDFDKATLLAPVPRPGKIICIGLNYLEHAAESKSTVAEVPTVFAKFTTAVTGHRQPIVLPKNSTKPDYEAELAVVIGRGGRHIPEDRWREHVFGYTAFNDVSARDFQQVTSQWVIGKSFDTFAPFGPAIVTADEIEDPHALEISLILSGEVMQHAGAGEMIFRIPRLISYLSSVCTLEPGDIIATGTPPGVGFARKPPRWLLPGDEATVRITGIPDLVNPVVAEE